MTKASAQHYEYPTNFSQHSHDGRFAGSYFGVDMATAAAKPRRTNVLRRKSSLSALEFDSSSTKSSLFTPKKLRKASLGGEECISNGTPASKAALTSLLSKMNKKTYYYTDEKPPQIPQPNFEQSKIREQKKSTPKRKPKPHLSLDNPVSSFTFDLPPMPTPTATRFSQTPYVPTAANMISPICRIDNEQICLHLAYETAIKASPLSVSSLSAEMILKHNAEVKAKVHREKRASIFSKASRSKRLSYDWSKKMFILIAGYILQYTSEGSYDRLPEQVLKLQAGSLVFATDVLEGKHWVLQVNSNSDSVTPIGASKPTQPQQASQQQTPSKGWPGLFSRFAAKPKVDTSAFLLVFENAEEMQEWMMLIRREIAELGGPSFEPSKTSIHSQRRLTKMSSYPNIVGSPTSPTTTFSTHRFSRASRDDTPSLSTVVSRDQMTLDNLRSNNSRGSNGSSRRHGRNNGSPETSPERSSSSHGNKRKSLAAISTSSRSCSSLERRPSTKSRPPSMVLDQERVIYISRTPSPPNSQFSNSSTTIRKSSIHSSVPIPVPSSARRLASAKSENSLSNAEFTNRPHVRRYSSQPTPTTLSSVNAQMAEAISTARIPRKIRPVSVATFGQTTSVYEGPNFIGTLGPSSKVPQRKKSCGNLKRRSMGALNTQVGPPPHPPPSGPLPKLPPHASSSFDLRSASKAGQKCSVRGTVKEDSPRKLNSRHSFHSSVSTTEVY